MNKYILCYIKLGEKLRSFTIDYESPIERIIRAEARQQSSQSNDSKRNNAPINPFEHDPRDFLKLLAKLNKKEPETYFDSLGLAIEVSNLYNFHHTQGVVRILDGFCDEGLLEKAIFRCGRYRYRGYRTIQTKQT